MQSGRPILAAVGLFFGGLVVGSNPGGSRDGGNARAAVPAIEPKSTSARGPVSPALRAIALERDHGDVEPPKWSTRTKEGAAVSRASSARRDARARVFDGDLDDPLAGLKMPDLPVPRHPRVLKYVRWFSESYEGRKIFSDALRRSGRFQEIIAKTFRERRLPQDLIAVAFIESGFSTEAISTAGAAGLWQFMPATARAYGLVIESTIDERASIWRSTEAAAAHLSDLYERFRSWELALAAYNLGYDGLDRRLDEYEVDDFWSLADAPGALPNETAQYVPKVLAAAVVLANVDELGFGDVERAAPIDAAELEVPGGTHLSVVARAAGTSLRVVRELNPELLADIAPDRGATAIVHVPRGGLARARTMLPKLALDGSDAPAHVSEDFDWGRDDVKNPRSRLERTGRGGEPRAALGARRSRRRTSPPPAPAPASPSREATDVPVREHDAPPRVAEARSHAAPAHAERSTAKAAEKPADKAIESRPSRTVEVADRRLEKGRLGDTVGVEPVARVMYRVVAGDSIQQIAKTVGLTVDQLLAQANVSSAAEIRVGTLLDLRVPTANLKGYDSQRAQR